jgi:Sortilin, neurotensin receptor 3,
MSVALVVGTKKGAAILKSADRRSWSHDFALKGWAVTASAADDKGRIYAAVTHDVYGPSILASDDLENWRQLEAAPRYKPGEKGNAEHIRIMLSGDFTGRYKDSPRLVDQIWTLHFAHGTLYAGVSEAGLFASRDRGKSWEPVDGFNNHPTRDSWIPGFGGLGAHTILSDASNKERMWVGVSSSGFFRTDDGGKTWTQKSDGVPGETGQCVHCVANDASDARVLYRQEHRGVYMSKDGGDSWQKIEDGLPISELSEGLQCSFGFPIVMDKRTGNVFVVPLEGDNFRFPRDGKLTVYRSRKGDRWEPLCRGLPDNSFEGVLRGAMTADQLDPGGVYFGTTSGAIYGTRDVGDSWFEIARGLPRILSVEVYAR